MRLLIKFLKAINSEASPWQIAIAIMLGMIVGLTPFWRLHNLLILFLALFFRINFASFLVSALLFAGFAWILDPLMEGIGESILLAAGLQDFWTALYNTGPGQLSHFNHTLTMGSLVFSLVLAPFILLGSRYVVIQYRLRIMAWVNRLWIVKLLKATKLFKLYTGWSN